ncbi:MAG: YggS family pyridoxal phosphate-dependent enzyme [Armatimonadetes bacterium]|nr:YggS family pyridoxal phosphate-dependent enzyme [Armatimonadota bacterium]
MATISENLETVHERIARAALGSGRKPEDVTLIVVTKTVGVPRIREAISAGATDLGENYVQEAAEKWQAIGSAVRWHFIGHLQRNKAKDAVRMFTTIQSVDSIRLAEEIGKRAAAIGKVADILIEVNLAGEGTKFGVLPEDALDFAARVSSVAGTRLQGFMGMAPFVEDPENARPYFARMKELWDKLPEEQRHWLSMGMSHDFEIAIEEGSNMVRIGAAIFGPRG